MGHFVRLQGRFSRLLGPLFGFFWWACSRWACWPCSVGAGRKAHLCWLAFGRPGAVPTRLTKKKREREKRRFGAGIEYCLAYSCPASTTQGGSRPSIFSASGAFVCFTCVCVRGIGLKHPFILTFWLPCFQTFFVFKTPTTQRNPPSIRILGYRRSHFRFIYFTALLRLIPPRWLLQQGSLLFV